MKAIAIYSGGMDSFTLVHMLRAQCAEVDCLSFDYGQRHSRELKAACRVTAKLGLRHEIVPMRLLSDLLTSALTSPAIDVPHGHYADESMKKTVVPNRNMIMLSIAIGVAVSRGASAVYCGVHAGDHAIYPDCRPTFIDAMRVAAAYGNYETVQVRAPFLHMHKGQILAEGLELGLDAKDYVDTWTCYEGRELACGKCGACVERLEAFASVGATDPLEYAPDAMRTDLARLGM